MNLRRHVGKAFIETTIMKLTINKLRRTFHFIKSHIKLWGNKHKTEPNSISALKQSMIVSELIFP
jgi:hypothetical protein